tara:strand:+ start:1514 stop:1696 length:183 start_codon:yes stop_codon:yes gene_type:complete
MNKELNKREKELLKKMNERVGIILKIEKHFTKNKIGIDTVYLDSLSDEKLKTIYETHCGK